MVSELMVGDDGLEENCLSMQSFNTFVALEGDMWEETWDRRLYYLRLTAAFPS